MEQYSKPKNLCINMNCQKHANFGLPGTKDAKFCFEHKDEDMVNLKHVHIQVVRRDQFMDFLVQRMLNSVSNTRMKIWSI